MGRAPCCDKAKVKRGPWSPEEDAKLKSYIDINGTGNNWITLPQKIGLKRCGKSCRLRWLNYLRPNIKHGSFSEEEDNIICTLYLNIGSRWSIIAAQLPGRTDNDIKNYWNTKLKKKLLGKQMKEQQATRRANHVMMIKQEMKREDEGFMNMMITADPTNNFQYPFDHIPSSQPQPFDQNSNINSPHLPKSDDFINFQEFNNWTIDQINELLYNNGTIDKYDDDGVGSFSGVEMVNGSSSGTTLSTESTSWGTSTDHMSCFISPPPPPPMIVSGDYEYSSQGFVQDSSSLIQDQQRYFGLQ